MTFTRPVLYKHCIRLQLFAAAIVLGLLFRTGQQVVFLESHDFHAAAAATCFRGLAWAFGIYAVMVAVTIGANTLGLGQTPIAHPRGGVDGGLRLIRRKFRKALGSARRVTAALSRRLPAR